MLATLIIALVIEAQTSASQLATEVAAHPTAAGYRQLASVYVEAHEYSRASAAFEQASKRYAALGDADAGEVLHDLSLRYVSEVKLYVDGPAPASPPGRPLALFEPRYGCYLGVNIEREPSVESPQDFDDAVRKPQAMFFIYRKYGLPFPQRYADEVRAAGGGLQIAWEPSSLDEVQDDEFLHKFARDAAKSGVPIFLRYASEMNGDWTPYHADPGAYVAKFRLVAQVMHTEAPNVAMVWCPNEIPQKTIPLYFPGDDAVDWVGINFYSVLYNDGDRARDGSWRYPTDALDYICRTYGNRHPIMVGEWAATHRSVVDNVSKPEFAELKISQFYGTIPRLYPQVKAVNWLSMDTSVYATGERRLNDFSLLDNPDIAAEYAAAIRPGYFLSSIRTGADAGYRIWPAANGAVWHGVVKFSTTWRSAYSTAQVDFVVGGNRFDMGARPPPDSLNLDTTTVPNGPLEVAAEVVQPNGRVAASERIRVLIRN